MKGGICVPIAIVLGYLSCGSNAGEIIKKTFKDSKGQSITKYVYQAGKSLGGYKRSSRDKYGEKYPAYRFAGTSSALSYRSGFRAVSYYAEAVGASRLRARTTRDRVTYNLGVPITIYRAPIRSFRGR